MKDTWIEGGLTHVVHVILLSAEGVLIVNEQAVMGLRVLFGKQWWA